jgi:hypothetical protein
MVRHSVQYVQIGVNQRKQRNYVVHSIKSSRGPICNVLAITGSLAEMGIRIANHGNWTDSGSKVLRMRSTICLVRGTRPGGEAMGFLALSRREAVGTLCEVYFEHSPWPWMRSVEGWLYGLIPLYAARYMNRDRLGICPPTSGTQSDHWRPRPNGNAASIVAWGTMTTDEGG